MLTQRNRRKWLTIILFLLPSSIGLLVFSVIPIVYSLVISFTDWNGLNPWNLAAGTPDFLGFGTSFVRLLRRKRLALATEMLQTATRTRRPQSIADVAFSVGFNDISNFNRAFKARYGRSPTDYAGALSAGSA